VAGIETEKSEADLLLMT